MKIIGVHRRSVRPNIIPVPCRAILQRSLGVRNLTGQCVAGIEHFEIPKQVIKILENYAIGR
jgi:hypothetical protein